jgi:hypothetical protein
MDSLYIMLRILGVTCSIIREVVVFRTTSAWRKCDIVEVWRVHCRDHSD